LYLFVFKSVNNESEFNMKKYMVEPVMELKDGIKKYVDQEITAKELKHVAAGFGIYLQRNSLMMVRIRVTGGHLLTENLNSIYGIIKKYKVPYIRVTTRQNLQLHDVNPEIVNKIVDDLIGNGFIVRGGGGNTFRSVSVSYDSGISKNSVFDVMPYAMKLSDTIYPIDKAFALPRKIKIAFSSDKDDSSFAKWQDLGFLAIKNKFGEDGFEVYIGGGMGRKSVKAIKIFDFISAIDSCRCAIAMINLFDENGNREDRSRARIRFLRGKIGDDNFKKLFREYYAKVDVECSVNDTNCFLSAFDKYSEEYLQKDIGESISSVWNKTFVDSTRWEGKSFVKITVSSGNLYGDDLEYLLNLFEKYSVKFIRINRVHELCVVLNSAVLNDFYLDLKKYQKNDFCGKSFIGHVISCVGVKVCPIGLVDSQKYAGIISEILQNSYGVPNNKKYTCLINSVTVCGCANSCGNPEAFAISVVGGKKKINGVMTEICKIRIKKEFLKDISADYNIEIPSDKLREVFSEIVEKINL
jgi:sulfite reductase beta subunit-like hemoprotein